MSLSSSTIADGARRITAAAIGALLAFTPALTQPADAAAAGRTPADAHGDPGAITASIERWAAFEARKASAADQAATPPGTEGCQASFAEKAAFAFLVVGGSIMLAYGPQEKENGVLTRDGKSEVIGGAAAIVLSVFLLRDILNRRPAAAARQR
jgi:hypothetical protein